MIKKIFAAVVIFCLITLTSATCNNKQITLGDGESATRSINSTRYTITVSGINDSRCPKGVNCIRAGEAIVSVNLKIDSAKEQLLRFCIGGDCGRADTGNVHVININNKRVEIKLLSVVPEPSEANQNAAKKATFEIVSL